MERLGGKVIVYLGIPPPLTLTLIAWRALGGGFLRSFTIPPLRVSTPGRGEGRGEGRGGGRVEESSQGMQKGGRASTVLQLRWFYFPNFYKTI